jgi:transposase
MSEYPKKKKRGRTAYTEEFRREAVRLAEADPDHRVEIARDLGVHPETLRIWCQRVREQRDANREEPIARPARLLTLEEENRRLRQENARLAEERDILKKATAFFARDAR